jgi:hypothetical protein
VEIWIIIAIIVYLGIGVGCLLWVQKDNEFRDASGVELYMYGSIILWPLLAPLWYYLRPSEQIQDLAAAKSHDDFKKFMRERKRLDQDILARLDQRTSPDKPLEIGQEETFRDLHLEELINSGNWNEAMRNANDMLRFAREQQEEARVVAYQRYMKEIMDRRRDELD